MKSDTTRPDEASRSVLEVVARSLGPLARRDVALGPRTTYRVGGACALWVEANDEHDLVAVHHALSKADHPVPVLVLGNGSNLLVGESGFPGVVVALGRGFAGIEIDGTSVRAGAAAGYPVVARQSVAAGLSGLEWAVGVPGSVGGALAMNAGGHGSDTAAVLAGYRVFDLSSGAATDADAATLGLTYRHSALRPGQVVVRAEFALERGDPVAGKAALEEIVRWRRAHQPGGSNAGSVFRNPEGDSAGRLVESAGLRGLRMGSAQVSDKHANFIQADDGGSADDVRRLMDHVRDVVAGLTGVTLDAEVHMTGFSDTNLDRFEVSTSTSALVSDGCARPPESSAQGSAS